jgi:hypothetical protein
MWATSKQLELWLSVPEQIEQAWLCLSLSDLALIVIVPDFNSEHIERVLKIGLIACRVILQVLLRLSDLISGSQGLTRAYP